jgi:hypothetical protein
MKKIFTICAVLASTMAIAQGPGNLAKKAFKMNKYSGSNEGSTQAVTSSGSRAVFYTNDFSNPSDWNMDNTSSPALDWAIVTALPSSLTGQGFGPTFNSTSGGNFALIDSDGAGGSATQNANMTTATPIDCSAQPSVEISFDNYHRIYYETHKVMISTDGVNYTEFSVNTGYGAGINYVTSPNAEKVSVNITSVAANASSVTIRFNYVGAWDWFWCIDDVELSDAPADDVRLTNTVYYNETLDVIFGTPLDYPIVPSNQIDNIVVKGTVENLGTNTATNAQLDLAVVNSASATIFNGSSPAADLAPGSGPRLDSLIWPHSATQDTYTLNYSGDFDNIANDLSANNTASGSIRVVGTSGAGVQWSRDNNTQNGSFVDLDADPYIMGNLFYVYNNITVYSIDAAFMGGASATDPGVSAAITLYELDPSATTTADAFVPLYSGSANGIDYTITASMIGNSTTTVWNKFPLNPASPTTGLVLEAGKVYMAAVEHYGGADYLSVAISGGTPNADASVWLYGDGGSGVDWYYMTNKLKIRFGLDQNASFLGVDEVKMSNLSLNQNVPNPANNSSIISYSLNESADVNFEIIDITGKVIFSENMGNKGAGSYSVNVNTADYAAGIYYYTMTAGADKITKKMMVTK